MTPFERALRQANELRYQAYLAEVSGDKAQVSALHEAATAALNIGKRAERLAALLETLAEHANGSARDLRRWSLALWVLGSRVKTLRAIRHRSAPELGGLAS